MPFFCFIVQFVSQATFKNRQQQCSCRYSISANFCRHNLHRRFLNFWILCCDYLVGLFINHHLRNEMGVLQNWYFCSRCALQAAARRRGAAVRAFIHHHVTHPSLFCFCFFQTSFWTMCTKQVFSLKKTRRHFKAHIDAFFAWVKILGRLKGCRK